MLDAGSPENIELVREHVEAYVRRDLEAMRRLSSADLELDWSASKGWPAGVYRGLDEVMRFYADYYAHFDELLIETESYTSTGDYVVVPNIAYQRGRDGIVVTARSTFVFSVCDGRITRICLHQDTPEALEAVGVEWAPTTPNSEGGVVGWGRRDRVVSACSEGAVATDGCGLVL